jgi:hypothetical protein
MSEGICILHCQSEYVKAAVHIFSKIFQEPLQNQGTRRVAKSKSHIEDPQLLAFGTGILHLIQINHQPDTTIFQFIILTFVYSSTFFGRFPAHHQELNNCSGSLTSCRGDIRAVFVIGPVMMGGKTPETC